MASAYFKLRILKKKRIGAKNKKKGCEINNDFTNEATKTNLDTRQCRICLLQGVVPIYGHNSLPEVPEYIKVFGDIDLNEDDEYPKYLCNVCHSLLQNAISFRKKAKQTDSVLRQNINVEISTAYDDLDAQEDISDVDDNVGTENDVEIRKSYDCKRCSLTFNSWFDYLAHKNSKQHKKLRIQCPICFGLLTWQLYKRHLATHQSATHLICEVCGKMYRRDNLVRHLQLHSFELPYQCQLCPYRGRFMESLKIHMRSHTGDKPFSCNKCEMRFLTRSNLNRHLLTHKKERPHKCVECGRGFYVQRDLDVHFKADHVGVKDFGCRMCGNKYGTRKALMRHELRVHKRDKFAKGRIPLYLQADYRK